MSEEKITSKELLNQLTAKHYDGALAAKAEGKPVVWATSICPNELLDAMDLATVYRKTMRQPSAPEKRP